MCGLEIVRGMSLVKIPKIEDIAEKLTLTQTYYKQKLEAIRDGIIGDHCATRKCQFDEAERLHKTDGISCVVSLQGFNFYSSNTQTDIAFGCSLHL